MAKTTDVKYPEVTVELSGQDGNAFAVLGAVKRALKRAGEDEAVCILSRGERGEGVSIISAHLDVNAAKQAARTYAYERPTPSMTFPLLDWLRDGDRWSVVSPNGVDFLEIRKLEIT